MTGLGGPGLHPRLFASFFGAAAIIGIFVVGRAVNIHLQTAEGFSLPGDTSETCIYFHEDIVEIGVALDPDGYIQIPSGPGIGVRVIADRLMKQCIHLERLR